MDGGDGVGMIAGKPSSYAGPKIAAVGSVASVAKPVASIDARAQQFRWQLGHWVEEGKKSRSRESEGTTTVNASAGLPPFEPGSTNSGKSSPYSRNEPGQL